ncbi:PREDICTED: general odorant-binding protein lush isoform X2 [Rhagoletis zephyria]|uniref:general odorant-binding protein lush isoform X2 n=1 Tax=Rhagoletis zephyria TaxID=28612 RepID=UPI0008118E5A|nr:PREDICTED: general odorant-binding protein lush isoform X2 [Rhagoletis zephyria]XP_017477381.1 PREDICTED: general odorant-binding protein lush isoform X2 [Rhagoletis zephyria]
MQQFETSLDMMRNGCAPKFKIPVELLDRLRDGDFVENNSELKCYTRCVAQLAGTLTKKGDFSVQKALAQIPIILPPEMQDTAREAMNACKEVQKTTRNRASVFSTQRNACVTMLPILSSFHNFVQLFLYLLCKYMHTYVT